MRIGKRKKRQQVLYNAYVIKGALLRTSNDYVGSKADYEQAYILVSAVRPDHHIVLAVAGSLISTLLHMKEYYDTERYAKICYECLTRPVDPENRTVADAGELLASVKYALHKQSKGE